MLSVSYHPISLFIDVASLQSIKRVKRIFSLLVDIKLALLNFIYCIIQNLLRI